MAKLLYGFEVPESIRWSEFVREIEEEQARIPFGWKPDPTDDRDFRFSTLAQADGPLEPLAEEPIRKTDFTLEQTPVRNQMWEGVCVGFACGAMKEWAEKKERESWSFSKSAIKTISPRFIYYQARLPYGWDNKTDQGAYIRDGFKVMYNIGAIIETGWPYQPEDWISTPNPQRVADAPRYKIKSYVRLDTTEQMARWLQAGGPFVAGISVFYGFFSPPNGVVPNPGTNDYNYGGHAIEIVGFDPDGFGYYNEPAFKFKNSWDIDWGQSGYGYLSESYMANHSGDCWGSVDTITVRPRIT